MLSQLCTRRVAAEAAIGRVAFVERIALIVAVVLDVLPSLDGVIPVRRRRPGTATEARRIVSGMTIVEEQGRAADFVGNLAILAATRQRERAGEPYETQDGLCNPNGLSPNRVMPSRMTGGTLLEYMSNGCAI